MELAATDEVTWMFEQLGRRARSARRKALQDSGLWPADGEHARLCCEQVVRGHDLRRTLLVPSIGDELGSAELLYTLADAHELGSAACTWVGGSVLAAESAGRACAMFAVSAALLDRVYVRSSAYADELASVFGERELHAMLMGHSVEIGGLAYGAHASDVAIALRSIAATIAMLRPALARTDRADGPLGRAIAAVLNVELRTFSGTPGMSEWAYIELARSRTELVFAALREIVVAHASRDTRLEDLFSAIAVTNGRNRDLAELCDDLRRGRLNSLAAIAGAMPTRTPNAAKVRGVAARLTKLDLIEQFSEELRANAEKVAQWNEMGDAPARLRSLFSSHARRSFD